MALILKHNLCVGFDILSSLYHVCQQRTDSRCTIQDLYTVIRFKRYESTALLDAANDIVSVCEMYIPSAPNYQQYQPPTSQMILQQFNTQTEQALFSVIRDCISSVHIHRKSVFAIILLLRVLYPAVIRPNGHVSCHTDCKLWYEFVSYTGWTTWTAHGRFMRDRYNAM